MSNKKSQPPSDNDTDFIPEEDEVLQDEDEMNDLMDSKIKKLKEELKRVNEEKQTYLDGWQRIKADLVNINKRHDEDRRQFMKRAVSSFAEELLPVLDSFEMATKNKEVWEKVDPQWRSGIEYIQNQLISILEQKGIQPINPLGEPFDPAQHNSVATKPVSNKKEDHTVIEVMQKGYILDGTIIRPPTVVVGEFKEDL